MAIEPNNVDFSKINPVQNGDGITPEHINYPLMASALVQSLATTQPDNTNVGNIGTPKVSIDNSSGSPRFKFENLKGATGAKVQSIVQVGTDTTTGGIIYQMNFDGAPSATFISPPPTKLLIEIDGEEKYYSIKTTTNTDDTGEDDYITFVVEK